MQNEKITRDLVYNYIVGVGREEAEGGALTEDCIDELRVLVKYFSDSISGRNIINDMCKKGLFSCKSKVKCNKCDEMIDNYGGFKVLVELHNLLMHSDN